MLQKVCLLTNYNQYETKRYFTQKFSEALKRKKIETMIVDANEGPLQGDVIASIQRFKPDCTCSFNSLLPISENRFLWDYLEIPHISLLVDPVFYSIDLTRSPYSIMTCVDRFDLDYLRQFNFENVFFWPHAVEKELSPDPRQEKIYDVVFMGSCYDYESLRSSWELQNSEVVNNVLDNACSLVLSDNKTSIVEALVASFNQSGLSTQGVDFITLFYYIDNYTRGKDRVELIRSIKDAKVHVFGELAPDNPVGILSWKQYLGKMPNVILHPPVNFPESLEILKKSKICLNSNPFFKNGSHERIFTGLACGALPITMDNLFVREFFKDEEDLLLYKPNRFNEINDKVNHYLTHEDERKKIVEKGRAKVAKEHTWDNRVETFLQEIPPILSRIQATTKSEN